MNPQYFPAGKREHTARVARAQFEFSVHARKRMNSNVLPCALRERQGPSATKAVQLHWFGVDVREAAQLEDLTGPSE